MNETVKLLLSLSLSGSILAVLIFLVKPLIKHKLSKSIQYYIWVIILLRLILPFSFETSIMNELFYDDKFPVTTTTQGEIEPIGGTIEKIPNSPDSNSLPKVEKGVYNINTDHSRYFQDLFSQYALYLWLIGAISALSINLIGYARFLKHLKLENKPANDMEKIILASLLNRKNKVKLVRNPLVTTPMLIGIIRPYIVIPDICFTEKQLRNILLHELIHYRHFDIGVKWLAMVATSIHWFNPLMYLVKKEINRACELACDETVIKNLSSAEKQAYGDTLISVVAEHTYPIGVLQATMCEEKKSLKERLIAIMKHNKKSKLIMILSGVLLITIIIGALYLGAGVGKGRENPPNLFISAENIKTKVALRGTYSWSYRGTHIEADSDHPMNFEYTSENIANVASKQQLVLGTQKLKSDKKYNFSIQEVSIYKDKTLIESQSVEPSFLNGNLYILAPAETGEYIYTLVLKFGDTGTASYGFVVRVDMPSYDLKEISKYKTPYVGNSSKISAIAGALPVPDLYFKQHYISMATAEKPYKLTIYYEAASDAEYMAEWPIATPNTLIETKSRTNAFVAFCMIDNVDEITFAFRTSKSSGKLEEAEYDTTFTFQRVYFEEKYGDLTKLGEDLELLKDTLTESLVANKAIITTSSNDQIEEYLDIIANSPNTSSNPYDYSNAHQNEYHSILKMGDAALNYLLSQFEIGGINNDLKGHIMMTLCKELLGNRNNVSDESLPPKEWYSKLKLSEEIELPDFIMW